MPLNASYKKHSLQFLRPAGTSRGTYTNKDSWFLFLDEGNKTGVGECSLLKDLSIDDRPDFEQKLAEVCDQINNENIHIDNSLQEFPSIRFGLETAMLDLKKGGQHILFPSEFTQGKRSIVTNGLIWMGDKTFMREQISQKMEKGFSCIKLKIGAIDWETEREIIAEMRRQFSVFDLTIRVDANGAFTLEQAKKMLSELAKMQVHSIEQPIKAGQWEAMATLCKTTPVPIALDEELIGIFPVEKKKELLETIHPQFLILKPSLLGGFNASDEWIELANKMNIGWWATSALEANIGLNAISQWVFTKNTILPQGLGTGMLFRNNIDSPLTMIGEKLFYDRDKNWEEIIR
ncbi:MAG TPA: o-succinylbenzoate synthase [Prolixibacteraceae bacterium]|nr:o-succinylbenzoate synthase [Prolixibacteraceae bacterium]